MRANYPMINNMSGAERVRNTMVHIDEIQVRRHLKYLFDNTGKRNDDMVYPVLVSEIADS